MSPAFGERANAVTARSISFASRNSIGFNSAPNDCATAWIIVHCPIAAAGVPGSRSTPTRVVPGAISLSSSIHFPAKLYSN
jgi:hypothetical protein